jgi:YebC/PmpR family DNA-binding regulatory protein
MPFIALGHFVGDPPMAGHSKWANIKHRKARQDASRGKVFTKYIRELVSAAKQGDPDPAKNPRLRAVVEKALSVNMTRDTINRAIQRGAGGGENDNMVDITYEGYGLGGVAVIVETMTDNVNRTAPEVRHAFGKHGGNLGTTGCVGYMFSKRGEIRFDDVSLEDRIMDVALESGADDVEVDTDSVLVITSPEQFGVVQDALTAAGLKSDHAEVTMHAATQAEITDVEQAEKIIKMIDMLEDLDDVQDVYTNVTFSDAVMAALN